MNVGYAVERNAVRHPERVAVFDSAKSSTYQQLNDRTNRLANGLIGRFGIQPGDRVALMVANRAEVVEVLVACAKARATYIGLNFRQDGADLRAVLANAEPSVIITDDDHLEKIGPLAAEKSISVLNMDDSTDAGYEQLIDSASDQTSERLGKALPTDDFCIVYTSGTTGTPKGVHFDNIAASSHAGVAIHEYRLNEQSRYLIQIPHNSSVHISMVPVLTAGGAVGFAESRGFDPEVFANIVEREQITHSFVVPTMLFRLLDRDIPAENLSSLQVLGYGSSPIPAERLRELVSRYGAIFNQLYGMAEIASIGTILSQADHLDALQTKPELLMSAGRPSLAVAVRVVDAEGRDVVAGETGEVIFGGPHIMKGYYRDPERTAEATMEGWIRSGDVGRFDEQGYLYIVDRIKDLIIRGGFNIAPRDVEEALYAHSAVLEASVVGVPDEEWGEAIVAFVALKPGHEATEEELIGWTRERGLSHIKVPESIQFLPELPKSPVGKILKRDLRDAMWQGRRRV